MGQQVADVERARDALARGAWAEAYALYHRADESSLSPEDLDGLSDAAWWLYRVDESIAARQRAYRGYAAAGADRPAGLAAWMLFFEHHVAGRAAVAAGWLARAQRHLGAAPECVEQAYLAFAESDRARQRGAVDEALALARRVTEIGRRCHSPDLAALGLTAQATVLLSQGRAGPGLALLDEAMCAVAARELSALFIGWIYCLGLEACMGVADLRRASEWTEAAMAWCDSLPAGTPFHGLCRVHQVEVLSLRGAWDQAQSEASRARDELLPNDPGVAAEAIYAAGEIRLRMGDLEAAEEAFRRAHELGRDPQPGLALLRLAEGKPAACAAALRLALAAEGHSHLGRARLLAAQVEVALATAETEVARAACDELDTIAHRCGVELLQATGAMARGALLHAEGHSNQALPPLRRALGLWLALGLPYEAAQARMLLAAAAGRAAGDHEGARLELEAARAEFDRLGAVPDARRAAALLGGGGRLPGGLTQREVEVLRLVAAGKTNRGIGAELVISQHTVARHLNNIFAKLGVSSRSAATAFAFTHDLV